MYRVIVIPTDGSDASLHAIPLALAVAKPSNAVVHVVAVMEAAFVAPIYGVPIAAGRWTGGAIVDPEFVMGAQAAQRTTQERALREFADHVATDAGLTVVPALLEGDVVDSLARYAERHAADLVALTTHGRSGIRRALFGSVTDSLIRRVSCPILVARPHGALPTTYAPKTVTHILVPVDGSPESDKVLTDAAKLAKLTGARCTLLHLRHPELLGGIAAPDALVDADSRGADDDAERAHLDRHAGLLRERGIEVATAVLRVKDVKSAIIEYAGTHAVDLIAATTHARHGLDRLMSGSIAAALLHDTMLPMLLFRSDASARIDDA
jgi:nucleotide-binding universal stress UspA family protein